MRLRFAHKIDFRNVRMFALYLLIILVVIILGYIISSAIYNQIEYQSITKLPY